MAEYCAKCGRERCNGEYTCPDCLAARRPTSDYQTEPPDGIVPPEGAFAVAGPLGGSGYRLPAGRLLHMFGPRGEGKTGLAHVTLPGADVVGREMDTRSVRVYQRALKVPLTRVYVPTWDPVAGEVDLHLPEGHDRDVIIDSASDFEAPRALVEAVARHLEHTGRRGVVITWETESGTAWGGATIGHLVWAVGRVVTDAQARRSCSLIKNRSGACVQVSFLLPWDRADSEPCYYSIEGAGPGRYRLAPYPHEQSATRADVWRHGDRLELPPAPAAASAKRLPGGTWSEPPDWRRRADYARTCGVPYFSPLDQE